LYGIDAFGFDVNMTSLRSEEEQLGKSKHHNYRIFPSQAQLQLGLGSLSEQFLTNGVPTFALVRVGKKRFLASHKFRFELLRNWRWPFVRQTIQR
jgi:hypothetical protein